MDGVAKARDRGVKFGRKRELTPDIVAEIKSLREVGTTVPHIMQQTGGQQSQRKSCSLPAIRLG
jgi:hypothetical protein